MSAFKDMVAADINNVFLNLDELGEEHIVDGKPIVCVISEDGLHDMQGGAVYAVGQSTKSLYAKCDDLPYRRGYGAELVVDGIPYMINTWSEEMGMATVNLFISTNSQEVAG